jgi:outer membrane protein
MRKISLFLFLLSSVSFAQEFSLQDCYEYAIKNHPDISNSTIEKEKEKQKNSLTKKDWLPTIGSGFSQGGSLGRNIDPFSNDVVTRGIHYNSLGLNASMTLYNGGKFGYFNKKQKENEKLSGYSYMEYIQGKKREIANLFYQVLMDRSAIKIQENRLEEIEIQKLELEELIKEGMKPKSDMLEIELLQDQEAFNLRRAKNVAGNSLFKLSTAIFYKNQKDFQIKEATLSQRKNQNSFFQRSPQFLKLISQRSINSIDGNILKSNYLPTLSFSINSGTSYSSAAPAEFTLGRQLNSNFGQYASFSLNFPIFSKGQKSNYLELNRLEKLQIENNLIAQQNSIEAEVVLLESELTLSKSELQSLDEQLKSLNTIQEVQKEKYKEGLITLTELNIWQNKYYQAQINIKVAEYQNKLLLALLALY